MCTKKRCAAHPRLRNRPGPKAVSVAALLAAWRSFAAACGSDEGRARSRASPASSSRSSAGRPVLRVESSELYNADLRLTSRRRAPDAKGLPPESLQPALRPVSHDEMILLEAARERGIALGEDERGNTWPSSPRIPSPRDGGERLRARPAEGALRPAPRREYVFLVVRDARVGEAEVRDYYEEHKKEFSSGRIQVQPDPRSTPRSRPSPSCSGSTARGEAEFRKIASRSPRGPRRPGGVYGRLPAGRPSGGPWRRSSSAKTRAGRAGSSSSSYGFHSFGWTGAFPPLSGTRARRPPRSRERITAQKMKDALPPISTGSEHRELAGLSREPILCVSEDGRMNKIIRGNGIGRPPRSGAVRPSAARRSSRRSWPLVNGRHHHLCRITGRCSS